MPIYAYRCDTCGHAKDVLQKISDPLLTTCPSCGAETFRKQLTAAGFQLKGSGWYVTDFRDGGKGKPEAGGDKPAASTGKGAEPSADKGSSSGDAAASAPAPAPAAAADAKPKAAAPAPSSDGSGSSTGGGS